MNLFCAFLKRYVIELTSRQASPVTWTLLSNRGLFPFLSSLTQIKHKESWENSRQLCKPETRGIAWLSRKQWRGWIPEHFPFSSLKQSCGTKSRGLNCYLEDLYCRVSSENCTMQGKYCWPADYKRDFAVRRRLLVIPNSEFVLLVLFFSLFRIQSVPCSLDMQFCRVSFVSFIRCHQAIFSLTIYTKFNAVSPYSNVGEILGNLTGSLSWKVLFSRNHLIWRNKRKYLHWN